MHASRPSLGCGPAFSETLFGTFPGQSFGTSLLGGNLGPEKKNLAPPPLYMREMGAICQIGVLTWKPCTFWAQNGSIFGLFALRFQ